MQVTKVTVPDYPPGSRGLGSTQKALGRQRGSHLTGPKLKAMKRRKTMMQTTFLFPDPNLSSLF